MATNKLTQTGWLKTIDIYCLTVPKSKSSKQFHLAEIKVSAEPLSIGGCRGESVPCVFQLLLAASIPWLVFASFQSLPHGHIAFSSSVYIKSPTAHTDKDACNCI